MNERHVGTNIEQYRKHLGTYMEQYKRMMRAFSELKAIYEGVERRDKVLISISNKNGSVYYHLDALEASGDRMYSFFQNCYHFKDWLEKDDNVAVTKRDINDFIGEHDCLKICADICNGSKHMVLDPQRPLWTDENTKLANRHFELWERGSDKASASFTIRAEGQTYDALELAEACIQKWNQFMTKHSIPIP